MKAEQVRATHGGILVSLPAPRCPSEGGAFKRELSLVEQYAVAAPRVRFVTEIYQCKVEVGKIMFCYLER